MRGQGVLARLCRYVEGGRVECGTCLRRCKLRPGQTGLCGNYENLGGKLYNIGYGLVSALESRPIEIKPFFHFHPGSTAMTFSGWGCNFLCPWCQNWHLSKRKPRPAEDRYVSPSEVVRAAIANNDDGVCASFNEPTIHLEFLLDVFEEARRRGLYNTVVSNGSATLEALEALAASGLDAMNVDLKGCIETYRKFIGVPDPIQVFRTARRAIDLGVHVESVFLLVTGANDSDECIKWVIERHLDYLGSDVPLHINGYYPAYKYDEPPTDRGRLIMAYSLARKLGVEYVYVGNIPDNSFMHTYCPKCGKAVIFRTHYGTLECKLSREGRCPRCNYRIKIVGKCRPTSRFGSFYY